MKITWLGHSCFLLEGAGGGPRVLTDPYEHGAFGGGVRYLPITDPADVVTVSHSHPDHNFVRGVPGRHTAVLTSGSHRAGGVEILGVPAFHDAARGARRGGIVLFRIVLDGVASVHLGDLGHLLEERTVKALSPVDVLLLPVGGNFTVGPEEAGKVAESLSPRLVIPMHFKTPGVDFAIAPVDDFLQPRKDVTRSPLSSVEVFAGAVPPGVIVLTAKNLPG